MKTLEDLKAFSLNKKQMNAVNGGNKRCDDVVREGNMHDADWDGWDDWADRYEKACGKQS